MSGAHRRTDRRVKNPPKTIIDYGIEHSTVEFEAESFNSVSNALLTPLQVTKRGINPKAHEANFKMVEKVKVDLMNSIKKANEGEGISEGGISGDGSGGGDGG